MIVICHHKSDGAAGDWNLDQRWNPMTRTELEQILGDWLGAHNHAVNASPIVLAIDLD